MKYLFLGFILLLVAIWLGLWISKDSGYVLISYHHWSLETSLWIALAIVAISFFILYCVIRLIIRTSHIPERLRRWKRMRGYRRARVLTNMSLCQLAEGDWQHAEKTSLDAAHITQYPLTNYLTAAIAANKQQEQERRDQYLQQALLHTPGSELAVGLISAQLQMQAGQWDLALTTLKTLYQHHPKNPLLLTLLCKACTQCKDWQMLSTLLKPLQKYHVMDENELAILACDLYRQQLLAATKYGYVELEKAWDEIPRHWRDNIKLQTIYAKQLLILHQNQAALEVIESALKKNWCPELIRLYGNIHSTTPAKQLKTAEDWLKKQTDDADLLLCLGTLSIQERFWGRAVEYLQHSIKLAPTQQAYLQLAQTYETLGQMDEAIKVYKQGLALTSRIT